MERRQFFACSNTLFQKVIPNHQFAKQLLPIIHFCTFYLKYSITSCAVNWLCDDVELHGFFFELLHRQRVGHSPPTMHKRLECCEKSHFVMEHFTHITVAKFTINGLHFGRRYELITLLLIQMPVFIAVHVFGVSDAMPPKGFFVIFKGSILETIRRKPVFRLRQETFSF